MSEEENEVMIDLETVSTRCHAGILVIAGVKFDRNSDRKPTNIFYRRIIIETCTDIGLHTDPKTIKWWRAQDPEIRKEAFEGSDRVPLKIALKDFAIWLGSDKTKIWSNGATFDIPILGEAFIRSGMEIPWKYWNARDTRTIYDLGGVKPWFIPNNEKHNALADCYNQIKGVRMAVKRLQI